VRRPRDLAVAGNGLDNVVEPAEQTVDEAIASGAGEAALWFMNAQPKVFGIPRLDWLEACRGTLPLHQNANRNFISIVGDEGGDLDDPMPVIRLMNRLWAGKSVDPVEIYEALLPIDELPLPLDD